MNFYNYFYHDVVLKRIIYNLENDSEDNTISFILSDIENNGFDDTTCVFRKIYYTSLNVYHDAVGDVCIGLSEINHDNELFAKYKKRMNGYISTEILNRLICYSICLSNGSEIIIVSECDVEISPTPMFL